MGRVVFLVIMEWIFWCVIHECSQHYFLINLLLMILSLSQHEIYPMRSLNQMDKSRVLVNCSWLTCVLYCLCSAASPVRPQVAFAHKNSEILIVSHWNKVVLQIACNRVHPGFLVFQSGVYSMWRRWLSLCWGWSGARPGFASTAARGTGLLLYSCAGNGTWQL